MVLTHVEQAARNNAIWCDAVCRAHDIPGEFYDAIWINWHPAPRFYSNAVTLSYEQDAAAQQLAFIRALLDAGLPNGWCIKDSFCTLSWAHKFAAGERLPLDDGLQPRLL